MAQSDHKMPQSDKQAIKEYIADKKEKSAAKMKNKKKLNETESPKKKVEKSVSFGNLVETSQQVNPSNK